ncbi:uncharacterized protein LOC135388934 [Ornithodoros turicata]
MVGAQLLVLLGAWLGVTTESEASSARDPSLFLRRYLHDPLQVEPFNATASALRCRFWDASVRGLSNTQLRHVEANLTAATLTAQAIVPVLQINGQYSIQGSMMFIPVQGNGPFNINATGLTANAYAQLEHDSRTGRPSVRTITVRMEVDDLQLHLHDFLGGGRWASFGNALLNQVAGSAFKQIQRSLASELESGLRQRLNQELASLPPLGNSNSSLLVDAIIQGAADELRAHDGDPLSLPDMRLNFDWDFVLGRLAGILSLQQCKMQGLSSMRRTGDILALYRDGRFLVEAQIGFDNISGNCDWRARVLGAGPDGTTSLNVRDLQLRLRLGLGQQGPLQLEALELERVGHMWLQLHGLGAWDFLVQSLTNIVANAFRWSIAERALSAIADELRSQLTQVAIPWE